MGACQPREAGDLAQLPYAPTPFVLAEPARFVKMIVPPDNPTTMEGVALGKALFFDPILSADSSVACASCHRPELAFTDGTALSTGIHGRKGLRSAMSLVNVGYYYKGLFWDGRAPTLEEQALIPIEDTLEMGHNWTDLAVALRRHPSYPAMFRAAFGISDRQEIDRHLTAKALAQFQRSLVSFDTKYDRVQRQAAAFTPAEARGALIFFDASSELPNSECGHCHLDPLFTDLDFHNNGIEDVPNLLAFSDKGRGAVTGRLYDNGKFRVPTLRNITRTAPYMHDGRFATLEEVIRHYESGGHGVENVSPNVRRLRFSDRDRADLIAFLHTLSD